MMTKRLFQLAQLALVSLCGLGGVSSTLAQLDQTDYPEGVYGWYEAGPSQVEDAALQDFFGNPVNGNTVKFDPGFHFGIAIGRELTRFLKVELESGFNYNALKSIDGAAASSGNIYRVPVMLNLVLEFPNRTRFVPMLGAGAGAQCVMFDAQNVSLGGTTLNESSDCWVFGYQGYAGVRYEFSETMSLGLVYHYSVADGPSWTFDSAPAGNCKLDSLRAHSLSLTFGWLF